MSSDDFLHRPPHEYFASYSVDLLYREPVELGSAAAARALAARLLEFTEGEVQVAPESIAEGAGDAWTLHWRGPRLDAGEPPEWRLCPLDTLPQSSIAAAQAQTWWWQAGREVATEARAALRLSDHRDSSLEAPARLRRFRRVLASVTAAFPALAILWNPTQQLVDPLELVHALRDHPNEAVLPGGLSVRFYRVESGGGDQEGQEYVMDTLGLGALGLTDLQCHFRGLDPDQVSQVLYDTGLYLIGHGQVIGDGHTVKGPGPQDRWRCRRRPSHSPPEREVLDLDPGFPFAGGEGEGQHK